MVLLYMVCHGSHQYTPSHVSIFLPASWIRHGIHNITIHRSAVSPNVDVWGARSWKSKGFRWSFQWVPLLGSQFPVAYGSWQLNYRLWVSIIIMIIIIIIYYGYSMGTVSIIIVIMGMIYLGIYYRIKKIWYRLWVSIVSWVPIIVQW